MNLSRHQPVNFQCVASFRSSRLVTTTSNIFRFIPVTIDIRLTTILIHSVS